MTTNNAAPAPRPGIEIPDRRGRTSLDQVGRDLTRNPRVIVRDVKLLTSNWYVTRSTVFDYQHSDGSWTTEERETYDRGDGACILLYNTTARTVILTKQFRYPAYVNQHPDGMLIEAAAGLLDDDEPEAAIRRECEEETGYPIGDVAHIFDLYMSPGSVTERLHFFAAPYERTASDVSTFAGRADEGEDIEVLELGFDSAMAAIGTSIVDAKTILLLQWAAISGPFAARQRETA